MTGYKEKFDLLRKAMRLDGTDAYIIPSSDPHLNEYIPDHWLIIPWLTGFTGSAATVVITGNFAGLWTDSRYFIQAEEQLRQTGCKLMRPLVYETSDYLDWLADNLDFGTRLSFDGRIFSKSKVNKINKRLKEKSVTINAKCDLISTIWKERPPMPDNPAFDFPAEFCGRERASKIGEVRDLMKEKGADYHLITAPDDIMWLLNIRGSDLKFSPLLLSYALVSETAFILFAGHERIPAKLLKDLETLGIEVLPYDKISEALESLDPDCSLLLNPSLTSVALWDSINDGVRIIEEISIPSVLKSVKNKIEIMNIERAMVKDGVALTKFFYWFESNHEKRTITELRIKEKILDFRSQQDNFIGPSFDTIAAFNEHAALPHYNVTEESDTAIGGNGILLLDSGGHYFEGTTDVTRTIAAGTPDEKKRRDFTLVLKGMISLANAKFPAGTKGYHIDILARKSLWENGLNYGHGTGHGVGFCLNVHEGSINITPSAQTSNKLSISPGMLFSNEPALYREGEYGIRTENMMICYEDEETEFGQFLRFETVTLCYIDKLLIEKSLLDQSEIDWINSYHNKVFDKLSPWLTREESYWLEEKTSFI